VSTAWRLCRGERLDIWRSGRLVATLPGAANDNG